MSETKKPNSAIYELATIGLLYGEDMHLLNNRLGAAYQHLKNIIEYTDGLDNKTIKELLRVQSLIREVLDFQQEKSELIRIPLQEQFDLREIIDETLYSFKFSTLISVERHYEVDDTIVVGYKRQVKQILRVLFHNANYVMEGSGVLAIHMTKHETGDFLEVHVKDTGKGMVEPSNAKTNSNSEQRTKKGFGIGLAWAQSFLRICGGDLSYKTEPGKGTDFILLIPRTIASTNFGNI